MKRVGITRKVDDQGRLTLPASIRDALEMEPHDEVEFLIDREAREVFIRKCDNDVCLFCGDRTDNKFRGRLICKKCVKRLMEKETFYQGDE